MQELKLPKRGQAMEDGTIVEWTVEEGEAISAGEVVVIFETDKTTSELKAEEDGILLAKRVEVGETVPIGTTLGYVGSEGEAEALPETAADSGGGASGGGGAGGVADSPERADSDQEDDDRGEPISAVRAIADDGGPSGTSGTSADVNAGAEIRASPSARRAARERGVTVEAVGEELGVATVRQEHVEQFANGRTDGEEIRGSPAARRIAEERGTDVRTVGEAFGTTRVRMADVEEYAAREPAALETEPSPDRAVNVTESVQSTEPPTGDGRAIYDSVPVTGARKTMHDRMQRVASEYGSTTTVAKVDVTDLLELRESLSNAWGERHGVSPSLTAFVVRAVAEALPEYRILNAEIVDGEDGDTAEVRRFEEVNVGIAVDTDHGLLVPTIYGADERTVRDLSGEIARLAEAARNRELAFDDQQNGTFTVSNAGTFGAYINTPQINPPQTAILGTCAVVEEPGIVDGEVLPREFMHLCLTYDHRVVEGATAVQFLQSVKGRLEEPTSLLA